MYYETRDRIAATTKQRCQKISTGKLEGMDER